MTINHSVLYIIISFILVCILLISVPYFYAYGAQEGGQGGRKTSLPNPLKQDNFLHILKRLTNILVIFAVPIYVLMVLYAGYLFLVGGANPSKKENAKSVLKYSTLGFIIIILGRALVAIIQGIV